MHRRRRRRHRRRRHRRHRRRRRPRRRVLNENRGETKEREIKAQRRHAHGEIDGLGKIFQGVNFSLFSPTGQKTVPFLVLLFFFFLPSLLNE